MNGHYWNGHQWVKDPPMAGMEPRQPTEEERAAIVDAELRPRVITEENEPLVKMELDTVDHSKLDEIARNAFTRKSSPTRTDECPIEDISGMFVESDVQLRARIALEQMDRELDETVKASAEDKEPIKDIVISDEVRERLRRELGIDGGSK